jgi:hypothetical protein
MDWISELAANTTCHTQKNLNTLFPTGQTNPPAQCAGDEPGNQMRVKGPGETRDPCRTL